ncbi:MAG: hypothetical protein P0S94_01750 [Simkaniaceae bacterium]|nr:hypothetical protein [Simkaniaceae bacterium]
MSDPFSKWLLERARKFDVSAPAYPDAELGAWAEGYFTSVMKYFERFPTVIERFRAPVCNAYVHDLVCGTLGIEAQSPLKDEDVRRAVQVALFMPLRQSVGSCFASAPAILIQSEQIDLFLDDMHGLLTQGKLKRTMGGVEYSVPINVAEHDCWEVVPLLKAWEYTLASFADFKVEFFKWNLRASFGFDSEEIGGIGKVVYESLDFKLKEWNQKLEELYAESYVSSEQVKMAESLLGQASSPDAARRQKVAFEMAVHQHGIIREMIAELEGKTKELSTFFQFLFTFFEEKFPDYFQEVYDPKLVEVDDYDDSPAGFRLIFKHGRANPNLWTRIDDEAAFITATRDFFRAVESDAIHSCQWEEGKDLIGSVITTILHHVDKPEFIKTAHERVAKLHAKAGTQKRAPWSYIAGGNMHSLLKGYYSLEGEITEEKATFENETDLAIFLIETLKDARPDLTNPFLNEPSRGMLMQTPTHACILRPGFSLFQAAWSDPHFTYTWVRDRVIEPSREFYSGILLSADEQKKIAKLLGLKDFTPSKTPLTPYEMRQVAGDARLDIFFRFAFPTIVGEDDRAPILFFADTNWAYYDFGFAYNPGTDRLELWRVHKNRKEGAPMSQWKQYLDGSDKKEWSILMRPFEYGGRYSRKGDDPRFKI